MRTIRLVDRGPPDPWNAVDFHVWQRITNALSDHPSLAAIRVDISWNFSAWTHFWTAALPDKITRVHVDGSPSVASVLLKRASVLEHFELSGIHTEEYLVHVFALKVRRIALSFNGNGRTSLKELRAFGPFKPNDYVQIVQVGFDEITEVELQALRHLRRLNDHLKVIAVTRMEINKPKGTNLPQLRELAGRIREYIDRMKTAGFGLKAVEAGSEQENDLELRVTLTHSFPNPLFVPGNVGRRSAELWGISKLQDRVVERLGWTFEGKVVDEQGSPQPNEPCFKRLTYSFVHESVRVLVILRGVDEEY
ncbi:hypothetical protein M3Y99_01496500 [Aphelenchoides fujianensis]|nr:hypothetical protein M3Y99_01496500 [Aphelenchoides fujianensis]